MAKGLTGIVGCFSFEERWCYYDTDRHRAWHAGFQGFGAFDKQGLGLRPELRLEAARSLEFSLGVGFRV